MQTQVIECIFEQQQRGAQRDSGTRKTFFADKKPGLGAVVFQIDVREMDHAHGLFAHAG